MNLLSNGILSPAAYSIHTVRGLSCYYVCIWRPSWAHSLATTSIPAFCICFWLTGQCLMVEALRRHDFHGGQPSCLAYYRCLITRVHMETHVGGSFAFICLVAGAQWPTLAVPGTTAPQVRLAPCEHLRDWQEPKGWEEGRALTPLPVSEPGSWV